MNYIGTRFFIVFLIVGTFVGPLHGDNSAIDLLELINTHTTSSKEPSGGVVRKNKRIKRSPRKPSAIKTLYVKAKLIAAKPINYVVNQKKLSAKHAFYAVAGLASFLLVIHGYRYMFDFGQIDAPHNEQKIPVPVDATPCKLSAPAAQNNNELPISQSPENPKQSVKDKVEPPMDQQESGNAGTPDRPNNPEQVVDENPEELKNPDVPQDISENNQQLVGPTDNSGGLADEGWSPEQKLVVLGTGVIEVFLLGALFLSISNK